MNNLSPIDLLKRLIPHGTVLVTISGAATGTGSVAFPAGRFTFTPLVFTMKQGGGLANTIPYMAGVSTSGATIGLYNAGGAATSGSETVAWLAVGV